MKWSERRQWRRAKTLEDLGEMNVKWLNGQVQETPGHMGPPDEETAEICDDLIGFNRNGLVTVQSQPGLDWEEDCRGSVWGQRAFVNGYCHPMTARRIEAAVRQSRCGHDEHEGQPALVSYRQAVEDMPSRCECIWHRIRHGRDDEAEAVTIADDHVHTAAPKTMPRSAHDLIWGRGVSDAAYDDLEDTDHVVVVDQHWGASRILWDVLGDELSWPGSRSGAQRE